MSSDWGAINREIARCRSAADPIACFKGLFERVPDGHVAFSLAAAFRASGQLAEASAWFRKAHDLYPMESWKQRAWEALKETSAANELEPAASGDRLGDYEFLEELGRGGFGVVYRVRNRTLNREEALKQIEVGGASPRERQMALTGAQAVAAVLHPNVVAIYSAWEDGGVFNMTMQYIDGGDLALLSSRVVRIGVERALEIASDVAAGLDVVHSLGLVHRDIKPANILLDRASGRALVTDFGLVRASAVSGTSASGIVGTPRYMAPEQLENRPADPRTDVYALGLVVFEMLSGSVPFDGESTWSMLAERVKTPPPPLSEVVAGVPKGISDAVRRALAIDPEERFRSPNEFVDALRQPPAPPRAAEADHWQQVPERDIVGFTYRWPNATEEFDILRVWRAPVSDGGHLFGIAHAREPTIGFGRRRASIGIFVLSESGGWSRHVVNFSEDDHGGHVSLIRGKEGRPRAGFSSTEHPPSGYDQLHTVIHADRVKGGYDRWAVAADPDDQLTMLRHAALQAELRGLLT